MTEPFGHAVLKPEKLIHIPGQPDHVCLTWADLNDTANQHFNNSLDTGYDKGVNNVKVLMVKSMRVRLQPACSAAETIVKPVLSSHSTKQRS